MKLSIRQRQFLTLLSLLILVFGIGFMIVYPAVKEIFVSQRHVYTIQQQLEADHQSAKQLRRSIQELDSITSSTEKFRQATIAQGDELRVITELEHLAERFGISQTLNVAYHASAQGALGPHYTFSFLNHATFDNHLLFLEELEQLPYYFMISSLIWDKRTGVSETTPITLRFDAVLYAYPI